MPHLPRKLPPERLIFLLVLSALVAVWGLVSVFTLREQNFALERARDQLETTVLTLADFNAMALDDDAGQGGNARADALWRALLQYPAASIWVEDSDGLVVAGVPATDIGDALLVEERRAGFRVLAALPRDEALSAWRAGLWPRYGLLLLGTLGFLVLSHYLAHALRGMRVAHARLEEELGERKSTERTLREHDALLNTVAKGAAELLGSHSHEAAIAAVLQLIGQTLGVGRVQLSAFSTSIEGQLHASISYEWCAPGLRALIDDPRFMHANLTRDFPRSAQLLSGTLVSFHVGEMPAGLQSLFSEQGLRSFLQIPVHVEDRLWGCLSFIDASPLRRTWNWAETDTLKTLAGLIGVAKTRARYVKELSDANMIVQNSPTILFRLKGEPGFPLIYLSHNVSKFGLRPDDFIGNAQWLQRLLAPEDQDAAREAMLRMLADGKGGTQEWRLRTGGGDYRWMESRYSPVLDRHGRLMEVEGILIDITERKLAEERIATLARSDALTGLANRATFVDRLRQAFAAARRGASPFAILYLDLDHFKTINDTLGHPVGDKLLRTVAERLRLCTRESDVVARLGGDEYAVLQTEMREPANAGALAQTILTALGRPYLLEGNELHVSASIGICPYSASSSDADSMLTQADLALYRAKEEGRNQYRFHSPDLDLEVLERATLAEDLRRAIERGELLLRWQPQVALADGSIKGMEALVAWQHPRRGGLKAADFITVAEKTGSIMALGHWVLNEACRQLQAWRTAGLVLPRITLNLSPQQIKNSRDLLRDVRDCTARFGLKPADLQFDVTEAMLAQATWTQNDVLRQLSGLGCKLSIANFGTEYSTFDYLRSYSIDHLKLGRSLLDEALREPGQAATLRAIVNLARDLRIAVVAEGVESAEQHELLHLLGAGGQGQGYYYSRPVDASTAEGLLRRGSIEALPALGH